MNESLDSDLNKILEEAPEHMGIHIQANFCVSLNHHLVWQLSELLEDRHQTRGEPNMAWPNRDATQHLGRSLPTHADGVATIIENDINEAVANPIQPTQCCLESLHSNTKPTQQNDNTQK